MQSKTDISEIESKKITDSKIASLLNFLTSIGFIVLILISNFALVPIIFGKSIDASYIHWSYLGIGLVLVGGFGKILVKIPGWIMQKHNT